MGAKNKVIEGDYKGKIITSGFGIVTMATGFFKSMTLDKNTVSNYEIIDGDKRISASSAIGRGALGHFLLGPIGLMAAASAKKKGVYIIALEFKDGKNSLIEVDDKIYKNLIKKLSLIKNNTVNKAEKIEQNIPEQIKQLAQLKEQGILTEEEFSNKKRQLLEKL